MEKTAPQWFLEKQQRASRASAVLRYRTETELFSRNGASSFAQLSPYVEPSHHVTRPPVPQPEQPTIVTNPIETPTIQIIRRPVRIPLPAPAILGSYRILAALTAVLVGFLWVGSRLLHLAPPLIAAITFGSVNTAAALTVVAVIWLIDSYRKVLPASVRLKTNWAILLLVIPPVNMIFVLYMTFRICESIDSALIVRNLSARSPVFLALSVALLAMVWLGALFVYLLSAPAVLLWSADRGTLMLATTLAGLGGLWALVMERIERTIAKTWIP